MDKQTLSNYGWIVIAVLVLAVMIAMATPFGRFIEGGIRSTTQGLFDVEQNALGAAGMVIGGNSFTDSSGNGGTPPVVDNLPPDTDTMIYRLSSLDPNITYTDFEINNGNRAKIGYTGAEGEKLVIPVAFKDGDGTWYKVVGIYNASSYNNGAFSDCSSLTSVVIPDGVTSIGKWAFCGCTSLTSVVIPDSVTSIGKYAFRGCGFTSIEIPNSVTSIDDYAFYSCKSLTSIEIPDSVTSISNHAFYRCDSLTSIGPVGSGASVEIPDSVTSIGEGAFSDCSSLTSVVIPDSVTSIGDMAFDYCPSLTSVVIPDSVESIGQKAFFHCDSLTSVVIGDSVTSIGENAFSQCESLTSVVIGDSVTSIGFAAFYGSKSLTSIVIPDSVTSISGSAFAICKSLTSITFENPNGWWYASSASATSGTSIDLSDPTTAATYFKSTYYDKYFKRS